MKKIIASGLVIVRDGKILLANDGKDNFLKIPGGKPLENESLEDCALRELKEETGYSGKILSKLSTNFLDKKPGTGKKMEIYLYHFKADLLDDVKNYGSFNYRGHLVRWIRLEDIYSGKEKLAPNLDFLIDKKEI